MKRTWGSIIGAFLMVGCASLPPSLPAGYIGETATIQDTDHRIDTGKADIFYLSKIDGTLIQNCRSETRRASNGQGDNLSTVLLKSSVPIGSHKFTIVGRTEYAMPIRALAGDVYQVTGDIEFSPKPNGKYVIRGSLSETESSVWIENLETSEIAGKIAINGSAKLGLFDK
ncbi:hypothetical protein OYT1_ch2596 [Ferriphaselus amnicola]|uniref:Lipoprotein n=1 Tax=Ferriphaselus amnicola TaxID=1188319 RepID=A0A2Z6GEU9_9PROT|nr:hypothetical protein [Ferriphaselus amnicola]BBE52108.1 hypothetical protein OYT1_ch2596 [Ferriphaselus amnicola]